MRSLRITRNVTMVALSGHAMSGERERFLAAGFDGYFSKPITGRAGFMHAIEKLAARAQSSNRRTRLP